MAEINLVFGAGKKARIGVLQFDCAQEEVHSLEAMITEHPVEEGVNISDHIRRLPYRFEITGIITNTPIINFEKEQPKSPDITDTTSPVDRVAVAYAKLNEILVNGQIVDVVTSLAVYKNMVIRDWSIPRNVERGNILQVTVSLQELLTATTEQVEAPTPVVKSKRQTTDRGKKTKKEANAVQTEKARSALLKLIGSSFLG